MQGRIDTGGYRLSLTPAQVRALQRPSRRRVSAPENPARRAVRRRPRGWPWL